MTLEQWVALPEDAPGELVDGHLIEEELPSFIHEFLVISLGAALRAWTADHGGYVLGSEWKLAVTKTRGRKGDLAVYLPGTPLPKGRDRVAHTPPDIVIEVITATPRDTRRDRIERPDEYAAFGVRWYWIVDPELHTLEVYENGGGRYSRALGVSGGAALEIPGLPGLTLDLDALWADVDRLAATADDAP